MAQEDQYLDLCCAPRVLIIGPVINIYRHLCEHVHVGSELEIRPCPIKVPATLNSALETKKTPKNTLS